MKSLLNAALFFFVLSPVAYATDNACVIDDVQPVEGQHTYQLSSSGGEVLESIPVYQKVTNCFLYDEHGNRLYSSSGQTACLAIDNDLDSKKASKALKSLTTEALHLKGADQCSSVIDNINHIVYY